ARHAAPALDGARSLQESRAAQAALLGASEEERRRLRRELHDDLGPALSGLALGAAAISRRAEKVDADLAESARELQRDISETVARSREISHGLRPPVLDDFGLEAAIRERLGPGDDVDLAVGELAELPAAVDLAALRIVQEAVTNVRRHARASTCRVEVARNGGELEIVIADDGVGMPSVVTPGLGLRSIRERAAELGGRVRLTRPPGGGTLVRVELPLAPASQSPASREGANVASEVAR
ncbi:sensor histidine kinase, partial [Agromyces seonyuensis]